MGFLVLVLGWMVQASWAFSLTDHETITRQAAAELNGCYPGVLTTADVELLVSENLDEDTNLFRKWTEFSHYYHPQKKLNMFRKDSMDRIESLEADLSDPMVEDSPYAIAGHMIHHLQDSAVPAHAVPVDHIWDDGFESLELAQEDFVDPAYRTRCRQIRDGVDPHLRGFEGLLKRSALETLLSLRSPVVLTIGGRKTTQTWTAFWQESSNSDFGQYGVMGNSFGLSDFLTPGAVPVQVKSDPVQYRLFKKKQIRLAVESTKKVLYLVRLLKWQNWY